jgi:hypothetical protein
MGMVVNATPRRLYPLERLGTHCTSIGGWVFTRVGLDKLGKPCHPMEFDPRTVQLVNSLYTD